jgi:hypothetical protein
MSYANKLIENFLRLPKLALDGSNWVLYKDKFELAIDACGLADHIDGTGSLLVAPIAPGPPAAAVLTAAEQATAAAYAVDLEAYRKAVKLWTSGEAIIRQGIAGTVPDSVYMETRKKGTAGEMWQAVISRYETRSRMVMVDMRRKLQDERCAEGSDVRAHLSLLQTMREDLSAMGASPSDDDFTAIILGSLPPSYDPFLSAITAATSITAHKLTPEELIHSTNQEADRRSIKAGKTKRDEKDAAFGASDRS